MPGLILSQWVMLKGYSINANMHGLGNNPENFFELVCLAIPLFLPFLWYLFISLICFGELLSNWSSVLYFSSLYFQSILLFSFHHHYGTDGKDLRTKKHNFKFQTLLTVLWAARELSGKKSTYHAGDAGDSGSIPGSGRSLGVGNSNPLQYCLASQVDASGEEPSCQRRRIRDMGSTPGLGRSPGVRNSNHSRILAWKTQ